MTADNKVHILVVDDQPEQVRVVQSSLAELDVVLAHTAAEALQQVAAQDFAVILIDVDSPALDGYQTAALLHKSPRAAQTPILFLAREVDDLHTARGYALGAADYLATPLNAVILRAKVRVLVELFQRAAQAWRHTEERVAVAQAARLEAAAAHRQAAFLAEASATLAAALTAETTHQALAAVALPFLADFGAVTLLPQSHERQGLGRSELAWSRFADAAITNTSLDSTALPEPLAAAIKAVLRSGRMEQLDTLGLPAADAAHTGVWGQLPQGGPPFALRAALILPLQVRSQVLGILTLGLGHSGRQFGPKECLLATELAARAAVYLDNVRLHRELQETDRRKNEFLAMLAHELRNPLAAIRGAVHVLCMSDLGKDKINWARAIIDRQVNQLVRLVDDLLDVARITQGRIRLQLEPVDISAVVDMAKELSAPLLLARRHNLSVSCPKGLLCVRGDAARLAQVLANLLNNAAKYTDVGGQIDLNVERDQDHVVVRVRDNGMGIPAELMNSIFDLFTQANRSLDRSQGGLGIGLTLVRHIVEMHGGSVGVSSAGQNQGSEFWVRLPLVAPPQVIKPPVLPTPQTAAAALRVLVVDDNLDVAESLAIMLRQRGHKVSLSHDGTAALAAAQTFLPQVVLLDIGLPGLDGYEVARRLRAMPALKGVFLVAITGYGQPEARLMTTQAGFDVHLVKPVEPRTLNQLIADLPVAGSV